MKSLKNDSPSQEVHDENGVDHGEELRRHEADRAKTAQRIFYKKLIFFKSLIIFK